MTMRTVGVFVGKVMVAALAFIVGMIGGGMLAGVVAASTGWQTPTLPPGIDPNATMLTMFATSPLLVLALYLLGRRLAGGWLARATRLTLLTWVAYTLNNVIEAVFFSSYLTAPWYNLVSFTPAVLLCAAVTAWLWPAPHQAEGFLLTWQSHFAQRPMRAWPWRLAVAALSFMPIYYGFGLLVVPFVSTFYQQGDFGLAVPALPTLLGVLLVRGVLFFVACLPVIVAWRGSKLSLWLSLGVALFVMVGLLYMLAGNWLPVSLRVIHSLEILADSFVHAGVLVWLLAPPTTQPMTATTLRNAYHHRWGVP